MALIWKWALFDVWCGWRVALGLFGQVGVIFLQWHIVFVQLLKYVIQLFLIAIIDSEYFFTAINEHKPEIAFGIQKSFAYVIAVEPGFEHVHKINKTAGFHSINSLVDGLNVIRPLHHGLSVTTAPRVVKEFARIIIIDKPSALLVRLPKFDRSRSEPIAETMIIMIQ